MTREKRQQGLCKFLSFLALLFAELSSAWSLGAPLAQLQPPIKLVPEDSDLPQEVRQGRRIEVDLGSFGLPALSGTTGAAARIGWHQGLIGADLRIAIASIRYGGISVAPSPTDATNVPQFVDQSAEVFRVRDPSDPWSIMLFEPGFTVTGRALIDSLPQLSESARVGLALGTFTDKRNAIGFSAILFTVEGAIQYQLGPRSPWIVDVGVTLYSGTIHATNLPSDLGRLPVSWLTPSVSIGYFLK